MTLKMWQALLYKTIGIPFPAGSVDRRPHLEYIPKTSDRPWEKHRLRGIYGKNMKGLQWHGLYESNPNATLAKFLFKHVQTAPIHRLLDSANAGNEVLTGMIYGVEYPLRLPRDEGRKQWRPPGFLSQSPLNVEACLELEETAKERFPCPDGFDVFFFVPKLADMWGEAVQYGRVVPTLIRGYNTLQDSLYGALLQRCKQENTIMHHYAFIVHVRKSNVSQLKGWYVHGRQDTRWNLARPRHNIGNNRGQSKLFVTESIPYRGTDAQWFPIVGYEEVSAYEGINVEDGEGPDTDP